MASASKPDLTLSANKRAQKARYEAQQELTEKYKAEFREIHQKYKDKYGIMDRQSRLMEGRKAKAAAALAALDPETRKALLASLK